MTEPGLRDRVRRFDLERRLALLLSVLAFISGIATYAVITGAPPLGSSIQTVIVLLNVDLVLLLALGVVVGRRVVKLVVERRRGIAGSRLHTRLVGLFAVVAATPAIIVSVFSVLFLSSGLEAWFSDRIRTALDNSLLVAEAYLQEHQENIRADALAMAADLNREGALLAQDPYTLAQFVNAQAEIRALSEAVVFDGVGNVLARSGLSFSFEMAQLDEDTLERAAGGDVVVIAGDTNDRVRALVRLDGFVDAYLFVGRFVDAQVLNFMQRTQAVALEYARMQSERWDIQLTSALLFGIVALLLLLAAVWVGLSLADRLAAPISQLVSAADRVRSGDLMARVPEEDDDDEMAVLSRGFNRMTSQLASQRRELVEANQQLDERRRFTEAVLAGLTAGVIGLDAERRIRLANRSAAEFLQKEPFELGDLHIEEVLPETVDLFDRLDAAPFQPVAEQLTVHRDERAFTLLVRIAAQATVGTVRGYVLTFDDITDLLGAQRQAAWAEVAKRIAHEIKNPLTPIRLSAERLNRRFLKQIADDDKDTFGNAVDTIVRQVDTIGRLIGEFSNFARMPAPVMADEPVLELVRQSVFLQRAAWPGITFEIVPPPGGGPVMNCDGEKVMQALTNLLTNAVQALNEQEPPVEAPFVRIELRHVADGLAIEVTDNGPGLPRSEHHRLLEPYVTTRAKGTGLGLAIVHKIMEEHNGRVELDAGIERGACVRLVFPEQRLRPFGRDSSRADDVRAGERVTDGR
ncbi:MAG: PAS domain-containing sensor histidine kinase [Geminicoccaceae bacterium]|nr:PAS domain-containing sensor histidine kinase [Geminicoccaceae bacterium]